MPDLLYASRIVRLPMLDPEGAALGRVADVVIGPAPAGGSPLVHGFVAAVPGRRIFLNAARVAAIDAEGLRLSSGALNLRRFAARPGEMLVIHDLLDRPVPGTHEAVNDVGLRALAGRRRGWEVAVVHLAPAGRRLLGRRRGTRRKVPWQAVAAVFGGTPDRYAELRELHPVELAAIVQQLAAGERSAVARALDDEQLADLLEELPEDLQTEVLGVLATERAADVLEAMAPDEAADLLGELGGDRRLELLAAMEPEEAEPLRRLLRYGEATAGGLMTPEPIVLPPTTSVAEALAVLRNPDLPPTLAGQVFVAEPPTDTPTGRFLGVSSLQRLLRERPGARLGDCLDDGPKPIPPELPDVTVAQRLAAYELLALPVCDDQGRLVGAITVDDALDHLLPHGWRQR
jgi:CBS domain-containing protein